MAGSQVFVSAPLDRSRVILGRPGAWLKVAWCQSHPAHLRKWQDPGRQLLEEAHPTGFLVTRTGFQRDKMCERAGSTTTGVCGKLTTPAAVRCAPKARLRPYFHSLRLATSGFPGCGARPASRNAGRL